MPTKPLLMIQTRYVNRPPHKQYRISLTKKSWLDTMADFAVAEHGDLIQTSNEELQWLEYAKTVGILKEELHVEFFHKTNGRLPPFLKEVLSWGVGLGYPFVGVFDDDAYYVHPTEACNDILKAFFSDDQCGGVGPMGMRKMWRYEGHPDFMEPMQRCPWAPLGSQIYRADALKSLDLSFLNDLHFRADAIIAMLLVGNGWGNYEMDLNLNHELSAGLSQKSATTEFYLQRVAQVSHDYRIYRQVLDEQIGKFNPIFRKELEDDLTRLEHSERNHNLKRIEKLTTGA
jgi:hypothetical protein